MALTQTPEEGLKVSNAPSDGKFLQYKDSSDKLTWATPATGDTDKIEEGNSSVEVYDSGTDGKIKFTIDGSEQVRIDGAICTAAGFPLQLGGGVGGDAITSLKLVGSNGSHHYISSGSGNIEFEASGVNNNVNTVHDWIKLVHSPSAGTTDTKVELYAKDTKALTTNEDGVTIGDGSGAGKVSSEGAHDLVLETNKGTNSGNITITDAADGNITIAPNGSGVVSVDGNLTLADSKQLLIGDASDLVIDHTGSHSRIVEQGTGDLQISSSSKVEISTSASNGDIALTPHGTGDLILGQGTLKWPQADGTAGQFLKTDGSDVLSWATVTSDPTTTSGTNNFTVADGNLVIGTAGHGIDFSATANAGATGATTTAELLDWYEYGDWTPTYEGGGTATMATQYGKYTRIGNMCHAYCLVGWSTFSGSGSIVIGGLPFDTAHNYSPATFGAWDDQIQLSSGYTWPSVYCGSPWDRDYFYLHQHKGDNVSGATTNLSTAANQTFGLSVYYRV